MKTKILITAIVVTFAFTAHLAFADARTIWDKQCASCHGKDGKGKTKMGAKLSIKDMTDAKFQGSFTDEEAFKTIKEGRKDKDGKILMKPAQDVSDDDIKALVKYVRAFKQ